MGVPKFYRWLSERFPLINQILSDSTLLPEIDNFYLDMNGIIHACTHPNESDTVKSLTFREMIMSIFGYIDRMVTEIVKPKKLLFMAIDGVAPRAKLNQQRSRRFRAAQERLENVLIAKQKGEVVDEANMFDSNCITPGTEFMDKVGKHLRWFIRKKMKEDPLWASLEIVFSGHDVPGEGEHKIMQYIREARAKPDYAPNLRHCMYGQDADLIMLGLSTHEPHFTLLREVIVFNSRGGFKSNRQTIMKQTKEAQFQLLHLSILREYIELDLGLGVDFVVDRERLIDDFVFLTFLVGNDFLPHLPTLDIGEHAFDVVFDAYKKVLSDRPGYLVENGEIRDFDRLEAICAIIGQQESEILQTREEDEREFNSKRRRFKDSRGSVPTEEEEEEAEEAAERAYGEAVSQAMGGMSLEEADRRALSKTKRSAASRYIPDDDEEEVDPEEQIDLSGPAVGGDDDVDFDDGAARPTQLDDEEGNEEEFATVSKRGSRADNRKKGGRPHRGRDLGPGATTDSFGNSVVTKDYRGRYYFQKFKVVVANASSDEFMNELITRYLEGLVWCLAYYVKGCISWSWYFPFHYGPMLQDMKGLARVASTLRYNLGQPFHPFEQLLGCLPPASKTLLPRPYQWLMTSEHSPVLEYYPDHFEVDMDGKRNPWEAVVLLPFIDARKLLEAEVEFCKEEALTADERNRNKFGQVLVHHYDPTVTAAYKSCNPDIGLPDVYSCQSSVTLYEPSLAPGAYFKPQLVPGTTSNIAGFPTLTAVAMNDVTTDFAKLNVFGSASKYRSMIMKVASQIKITDASKLSLVIGKSVFVNYPQLHEAKVVAVTTEKEEIREMRREDGSTEVVTIPNDEFTARKWKSESSEMESTYLRGKGQPGIGGLDIGEVCIRLRLLPLQGMQRDRVTGAKKKVFGTAEADVPAQLVLWSAIVSDPRFQETGEVPVATLFPNGCEVVSITGQYLGCKGKVVGPHAEAEGAVRASLRQESSDSVKSTSKKQSTTKACERVVDVEFTVMPAEPTFGYAIAASVHDKYFPSREVCNVLKLSPSLLGKLAGAIFVEPSKDDIGLNFKRNGQYQLLGYCRRVDQGNYTGMVESFVDGSSSRRQAWGGGDTVQIIGSVSNDMAREPTHTDHVDQWEYSSAAVALIVEYQEKFPTLFHNLMKLPPNSPKYSLKDLFGQGATQKNVEEVLEWMKGKPFFNMPRTPLSTIALSRDAMQAIERAVDVRRSYLEASGPLPKTVVRSIPVGEVFRGDLSSPFDAPLALNTRIPRLGDRIVNLNSMGVPCGLKGTVVTIHGSTGFVEVIFDEEFVGGRSLQGSCSQFRGRLCPWSGLLKVSTGPEAETPPSFRAQTYGHGHPSAAGINGGARTGDSHKTFDRQERPGRGIRDDGGRGGRGGRGHRGSNQDNQRDTGDQGRSGSIGPEQATAPQPLDPKKKLSVQSLLSGGQAPAPDVQAVRILTKPIAPAVEATPVPIVSQLPQPADLFRADMLEALLGGQEADASTSKPALPSIVPAVSDGTGKLALAAAASTSTADGDSEIETNPGAQFDAWKHGFYGPSQTSFAARHSVVPTVPHNQRLPSPIKSRKPEPATAPSQTETPNESNVPADAPKRDQRPSKAKPSKSPEKSDSVAANLSTMRKIQLPFGGSTSSSAAPAPAPAPASESIPAPEPQKSLSTADKLAAARKAMKKSLKSEKDGSPAVDAPPANIEATVTDAAAATASAPAAIAPLVPPVNAVTEVTSASEQVQQSITPKTSGAASGGASPATTSKPLVPSAILLRKAK